MVDIVTNNYDSEKKTNILYYARCTQVIKKNATVFYPALVKMDNHEI